MTIVTGMKHRQPSRTWGLFRVALPFFGLAVALLASSCSTVKVTTNRASLTRGGIESARDLQRSPLEEGHSGELHEVADTCIELLREGRRHETFRRRQEAAGSYLRAAVTAREHLVSGKVVSDDHCRNALIDLHNRSLARFAELWSADPRRLGGAPYHFTCRGESYEIVLGSDSDYRGDFFDKAIAAESLKGKGIEQRSREGYGAALVGIREQTKERAEELKFFSSKGMHVPVTLTVSNVHGSTENKVVELSIYDSSRREVVQVGANEFPLAADFSAPLELLLQGSNELIAGLTGFLNARERAENSGIYLLEPYEEDRIPVILTHGLISVPIIWRDIIPEFLSDPEIANRYQFFVFTYPSSYPIPESAQLFRQQLAELRQKYDPDGDDPLSTNIVAMGHSMGGVLTRLLVTDIDDRLWDQVADVPVEQLEVDATKRAEMKDLLYFDPDPAVRRAVFLSTPHGGAELATLSIADFVSRLAKMPQQVLETTAGVARGPLPPGLKIDVRKKITSVQSLRPDSPIALALNDSPYNEGVVYHSVIGDRGKGDTPDSSDGVVDYWSSHQPGAASELIVPTGHSTYVDPNAKEELKRILRAHLRR